MDPTPEQVTASPANSNPTPSTPPPPLPKIGSLPGMPSGSLFSSGSSFGGSGGGGGSKPILFALIAILALGAIGFGIMTVVYYNKAAVATKTVDDQVDKAVRKAKAEQKKADDEANTIANESPFRSYVAPVEYGSFEIKFPKNWSSYVSQQKSGTQVSLVLNPDFVRKTNGTDELSGAKIELIERSQDQFMAQYNSLIKSGKLKQADATVSGQKGYDITGTFSDKRTTRLVMIPVRDKVIVFTNENSLYANEFNQILAQSKIIP